MKILYIVSTLRRTGPTNQLLNIVKNLDPQLFKPTIVTLSPEPNDSLKLKFLEEKIEVESLNLSRMQSFFKIKKCIKQVITKHKPDVIHTQGLRADTIAVKYLQSNFSVISSIRNFPFEDYPLKYGKFVGNIMAKKHKKAIKLVTRPVACSNSLQKTFKNNLNIDMFAIQNGVDTQRFKAVNTREKKIIRKKLGIALDQKIFISVGSMISRKAPEIVVRAFLKSNKENKSVLYMLGNGPLIDKCKDITKNDDSIVFLGSVSNVNEYLQAADYFISASKSEGLPNTVLEALSSGLPVCLSDIEPHKEILALNSKAGKIFETGNVSSLTRRINELLNEDYKQMTEAATKLIEQNLSAKVMSGKYQKLYREVINKNLK